MTLLVSTAGEGTSSGPGVRATTGPESSRSPSAHSGHCAVCMASGGKYRWGLFRPGGTYHPGRKATTIMWSDSHRAIKRAEGNSQSRNEMFLLRAARPDDVPLTGTTSFLRIRAASSRPGTQPHHPQKQRPFLSQAGDFITHSRTARGTGRLSSARPGTKAGKAGEGARGWLRLR